MSAFPAEPETQEQVALKMYASQKYCQELLKRKALTKSALRSVDRPMISHQYGEGAWVCAYTPSCCGRLASRAEGPYGP
jgi:hypothetical protein